jgi:hypothetical protein
MSFIDRILIALRLKSAPLPPVELPKVIPLVPPKPHFVRLDKVRGAPTPARAGRLHAPRPMPAPARSYHEGHSPPVASVDAEAALAAMGEGKA